MDLFGRKHNEMLRQQNELLRAQLDNSRKQSVNLHVDTVKRLYHRAKMQFESAKTDRTRTSWTSSTDTPYNDIKSDISNLIARARYAYDNDPTYYATVESLVNNIISTGMRPKAVVANNDGKFNTRINDALDDGWKRYNDEWDRRQQMTFSESQRLCFRVVINSGGILTNTVRSAGGTLIPIAKQMFEPDRLDDSHDNSRVDISNNSPATQTLHGIQVDEYGKANAYWVKGLNAAIPAVNINHTFIHRRPEQFMGVPWAAPVLDLIWDMHQLHEDTLMRSRALADFLWWLERGEDDFSLDADKDENGNVAIEKLTMLRTAKKPELIAGDDSITQVMQPLTRMILQIQTAAFGSSYMTVTRDLTDVNFAASRTVVMEERRMYRAVQKWWAKTFCQKEWENYVWWMAFTSQIPGVSLSVFQKDMHKFCECWWQADGWDWVDPLKDASADVLMRENLLATDKELLGRHGKDLDSHYRQLSEEAALRKKYDLPESTAAASGAQRGNADDGQGGDENGKKSGNSTSKGGKK